MGIVVDQVGIGDNYMHYSIHALPAHSRGLHPDNHVSDQRIQLKTHLKVVIQQNQRTTDPSTFQVTYTLV